MTVPDGTFFANATLYVNDDNGGNNEVHVTCHLVQSQSDVSLGVGSVDIGSESSAGGPGTVAISGAVTFVGSGVLTVECFNVNGSDQWAV